LWPGGNRFIVQPVANHNGGTLAFGPDGYLYIGLGDGGSGNDPGHLAQNPTTLLGKMLRVNVNVLETNTEGYDVPADNPFVDGLPLAALSQIWAFGLRNPWKYSFDNVARGGTGALIIGDVGQNAWEEINYEPPGAGGRNYGWRNREGAHDNVTNLPAAYVPLKDPIFEYNHNTGVATGVSITGGYVYRGTALGLTYFGRYFFGDLSGKVWSIALTINGATGDATASGLVEHTAELGGAGALGLITAFGEDASGELYVVNYTAGSILRISSACPVTLNPLDASYDAAGGNGQVSVTTACAWTATSNAPFLMVTAGSSGNGNGTVSYSVASNTVANTPRVPRSGTLVIADRLFTASQSGCSYTVAPTSASHDVSGGNGTVTVSASTGCTWTAVSNSPAFIDLTSGSTGTGNGTVGYAVAPNVGAPNEVTAPRLGSLSIAGQAFTVNQPGCTFGIAPTGTTFGSAIGSGAVSVETPSVCSWSVAGVPDWASTSSGGSGTGPGTWQFTIADNGSGTTRSQAVLVAGRNFQLRQLAAQLTPVVPGKQITFPLANATDERWTAIEAVIGRSYCAQVTPGTTSVDRATPMLTALRADGTTSLGSGSGAQARTCFIAPETETALLRITQADAATRQHQLAVAETTLWVNWFFIGGDYSSYTILRNTTTVPVTATITWRSQTGTTVGVETVAIPSESVIYRDARVATGGVTLSGSVEVAHDGEPQAIDGSHTTLSATTGLSFDTVLVQRRPP
jgi:hypothetical protein